MGKWLDVIASQLSIRINNQKNIGNNEDCSVNTTSQKYIYKDVTDETRKLFKKVFSKHLYRKLNKIKVGECVDYTFDYGKERSLSIPMDGANQNLIEVFSKLPELPEGESYAFPTDSYVSFSLRAKFGKTLKLKLNFASYVFINAGLEQ